MLVEIHDAWVVRDDLRSEIEHDVYLVNSEAECKCSVSKSAYQLAVQFGNAVTMGSVTASPVF